MAYNAKITTSKHGRRLGLQAMSSAESGSSRKYEFLVGPESLRVEATTNESTATNLKPFGVSKLISSSAASSQVYTIDPPIPGVMKVIVNSTDAVAYVKTANSETIVSSKGSTNTVITMPVGGAAIQLWGLTTGQWVTFVTTTAIGLTTTT